MSTRLRLFRDIFAAMYKPMASKPFHCFCSVKECLLLNGSRSMNGSSTRKLKAMWQVVRRSGKLNPYTPRALQRQLPPLGSKGKLQLVMQFAEQ